VQDIGNWNNSRGPGGGRGRKKERKDYPIGKGGPRGTRRPYINSAAQKRDHANTWSKGEKVHMKGIGDEGCQERKKKEKKTQRGKGTSVTFHLGKKWGDGREEKRKLWGKTYFNRRKNCNRKTALVGR